MKTMKITSGKGLKKYYTERFGKNIKILKAAENQETGSTMVILEMKRNSSYAPESWYVVYSSGDYGEYGSYQSALAQFNKMANPGNLI